MEIKIILILLLIHYISLIFIKPKINTLYCGIFLWAGKSVSKFNKAKFDILGLYNDSRGGDSCGVTTDGEIYHGIQSSKHYNDFIINQSYLKPTKVPAVFGHTRRMSVGFVNKDNAHPFGFGEYNEGFKFIGVHNGTITNQSDLSTTYGVDMSCYRRNPNNPNSKIFERNKIDSEILLECIYKSKDIKVLEEYIGGAALIFQDLAEPNVVYIYHGASKKETTDKNDKIYEERPLYYYKENKNSLYVSSMPESLVAIGGDLDKNIKEVDFNIVYKITDGDIDNAIKIKVDRSKAGQKKGYVNFSTGSSHNYKSNSNLNFNLKEWKKRRRKNKLTKSDNSLVDNIYEEPINKYFKSLIYYHKLRYWRNGHELQGIYTYILNYGLFFVSEDIKQAEKLSLTFISRAFDTKEGRFLTKEDEKELINNSNTTIPFMVGKNTPNLLYFYKGILLKSKEDYEAIVVNKIKNFSLIDLSHASKYPICDHKAKKKSKNNQGIYLDGVFANITISPLQSGKIYDIGYGDLISIEECDNVIDLNSQSYLEKVEEFQETLFPNSSVIKINSACSIPFNKKEDIIDLNNDVKTSKYIESQFKNINNEEKTSSNSNTKVEYFLDFKENNIDDLPFKTENEEKVVYSENSIATVINEDPTIKDSSNEEEKNLINELMLPIYLKVQEANDILTKKPLSNLIEDVIEINGNYLVDVSEIVDHTYNNN